MAGNFVDRSKCRFEVVRILTPEGQKVTIQNQMITKTAEINKKKEGRHTAP